MDLLYRITGSLALIGVVAILTTATLISFQDLCYFIYINSHVLSITFISSAFFSLIMLASMVVLFVWESLI